jgi:hypothetical protein
VTRGLENVPVSKSCPNCQNSIFKVEFVSPEHLYQTTFKTLKCPQLPCFETATLGKNLKLSKMSPFLWATLSNHKLPKVAKPVKNTQSGHPD